jgi:Fe-S cluster assembly protein SufD
MSQLAEKPPRTASPGTPPAWLENLRQAAKDRFQSTGYPTTSQEDWRFTNITPIARTEFSAADDKITDESRRLADESAFGPDAAAELVFVNGHYAPGLSHPGKLPRGVALTHLAHATSEDLHLLQNHLGKIADFKTNPFVALNTSALHDAAILHVPRGVTIESPIHFVFIADSGSEAIACHPRLIVISEANCEFTLVETYAANRGVTFTNAVTEIFIGDDSRVSYNRVQRGGAETLLISTLAAKLGTNSRLVSHAATLGGKLTRNDLNVTLAGKGADATLNGLVILDADQHCDNHTLLDHASANCPSHELYKHVLDGKSSCVFRGKILVRQDSQKTDSKQTSKSLLLSDDATMNSQPALEIYADDVKCTHGSTTGPVDEEMIFYLRTRGVGLEAARHLLTYAFAADVTRRIKVEPVRRRLEDYLAAHHGLPRDLRITDLGEHDEKAR